MGHGKHHKVPKQGKTKQDTQKEEQKQVNAETKERIQVAPFKHGVSAQAPEPGAKYSKTTLRFASLLTTLYITKERARV